MVGDAPLLSSRLSLPPERHQQHSDDNALSDILAHRLAPEQRLPSTILRCTLCIHQHLHSCTHATFEVPTRNHGHTLATRVTPSDPLPIMNRNNMPLSCTICDKKPTFSDISHLLTHISSKQHLSNYFKIQVQSNGDDEAQNVLDRFNAWYEKWDMAELLKERMCQKEKKKSGKPAENARPPARRVPAVKPADKVSRGTRKTTQQPRDTRRGQHIATDEHNRPLNATTAQSSFGSVGHRAWSDTMQFKQEHLTSSDADAPGEYDLPVVHGRSLRPYKSYRMSDETNDYTSEAPDSTEAGVEYDDHPGAPIKEGIKLKGVIWPGMHLFDAATPEMQRKRNQKKTVDVVALLQATSRNCEPDEMIYDIDGAFLKQREITGDPDDRGTPLSGETTPEPDSPPPRKRTIKSRKSRASLHDRDESTSFDSRRSQRSHTSFGNKRRHTQQPLSDDEDDGYTYQAPRAKRSGFSIHRDNSGPSITLSQPAHDALYRYGPTPIENTFSQYSGRYDASLSLNQHYPQSFNAPSYGFRSADRDLSTFGSLTHGFRPTYNPFSAVDSVRYRATQSNLRSPLLPSVQAGNTFDNQANITWNSMPHLAAEPVMGVLDEGVHGHARAATPIFWNSDHFFGDDKENIPPLKLKQEEDGDTISLPSDQK